MSKIIYSVLFTCIIILFSGCAHNIYVASDAYADSELIPYGFPLESSFTITPVKNGKHNTMLSKEASRKIGALLDAQGYTITTESSEADYELSFSYATKSTLETRTVTAYIPGTTQVTQGVVHGYTGNAAGGAVYQEQTSTPGSFVSVPEQYTLYHHTLTVHVHAVNQFTHQKKREEVWQITTSSSQETSDIRTILDYLIKSALNHFGHSTGQCIVEKHQSE